VPGVVTDPTAHPTCDDATMEGMRTDVAATMTISSPAPATALLQVAAAAPAEERLTVLCDGRPLPVEEFAVGEARVHRVELAEGTTTVAYTATVEGGGPPRPVTPAAWVEALRPSRYCPSDQLEGFASTEFDRTMPPADLVETVAGWVHDRLSYTAGASRPVDTAVDTLLTGRGVCRDYAHLTVTLLRALEVPARMVAVYAPGLDPMDFHAVVEADVDGSWHVVDATRLAPLRSLVRICSGRDAADTAFLTTLGGVARFESMTVTATVEGELPVTTTAPHPLP
jgi:transglutaminase-like putative cysteine protease